MTTNLLNPVASFAAGLLLWAVGSLIYGGCLSAAGISTQEQQQEIESMGFGSDSDAGRYLRLSPQEREAAFSSEVKQIRIAEQYGLAYLPLMVVRQYGLIEKHASALGLAGLSVSWIRYPSGKAMNDALQFGLLEFGSGGVAPLLEMWDKTFGDFGVKGVASLSQMPMYLNVNKPNIETLKDLNKQDLIALPAVKVSLQAVTLQMAAAKSFGDDRYDDLDGFTVSMSHPEAMKALLSGQVTAHFASPPFQYQELETSQVHTILSSYDVLGGPATLAAIWTRSEFHLQNPKTYRAVFEALEEAMSIINKDKRKAAQVYNLVSNSRLSVDFVQKIINDPQVRYTTAPQGIMKYARFMHRIGSIQRRPQDWRDVFFPFTAEISGS